ncbi:acetyl-CoA carboxylase biotin carboxylase subunit family protein [Photobacterium sp. 1_MG-2023]|uniref:ATP-grasp domain-containing protein n=1 Tax=Photobacterium sp. 1_MG-2023 TaxID=3062646 RepID=UPI0026E1BDE2|nr:ATP-grasp domain-containing protein [Photobacterium sp. 1_MG-2023]MDO6708138.1 ATP-grasp domain-containing protein [Photobacterium sp. 1_MG-2023]
MTTLILSSKKFILSIKPSIRAMYFPENTLLITEQLTAEERDVLVPQFGHILELDDYFSHTATALLQFVATIKTRPAIEKVLAFSEGDILRAAQIREILHLPGQHFEQAILFRDKILMKQHAARYGVMVAMPQDASQVKHWPSLPYPIVIKPAAGRGSQQTLRIESFEQWSEIRTEIDPTDMIIEPFIEGEVFHIDGLVVNGNVLISSPARYVGNCMDFVGGQSLGSYTLSESNPLYRPLTAFSRYLLEQVFPTPQHSLFHIECFVDNDQQITLCEIACRLGGNDLLTEVELAYAVNVVEAYLHAEFTSEALCEPSRFPMQVGGRFQLPPQSGHLTCKGVPTFQHPGIVKFQSRAISGHHYQAMTMSNDALLHVVAKANSEAEMETLFRDIAHWAASEFIWSTRTEEVATCTQN